MWVPTRAGAGTVELPALGTYFASPDVDTSGVALRDKFAGPGVTALRASFRTDDVSRDMCTATRAETEWGVVTEPPTIAFPEHPPVPDPVGIEAVPPVIG